MIVEERMRTFINSLDAGNTPFLDELECSALSEGVPIIRNGDAELYKDTAGT